MSNYIYKLYKKLSVRLRRKDTNYKTVMPTYGTVNNKIIYCSSYDKSSIVATIIYLIDIEKDNKDIIEEYNILKEYLRNSNCKYIENIIDDRLYCAISIIDKSILLLHKHYTSSYIKDNILLAMIIKDIKEELPIYNDECYGYDKIFNANILDIPKEYTKDPIHTNTSLLNILKHPSSLEDNIIVNINDGFINDLYNIFNEEDLYELVSIDYLIIDYSYIIYYNINGFYNTKKDLNINNNVFNIYMSDIIKNTYIYDIDYIKDSKLLLSTNITETLYNKYMKLLNNKSILNDDYNNIDEIIE